MAEIHKNLKSENDSLKEYNEKLEEDYLKLEEKMIKQSHEVSVFSRALELKVEEFKTAASQMGVDIKAALL